MSKTRLYYAGRNEAGIGALSDKTVKRKRIRRATESNKTEKSCRASNTNRSQENLTRILEMQHYRF